MPVLNFYEKWCGCKVALSNLHQLVLDADAKELNKIFILAGNCTKLLKNIPKDSSAGASCREFYVCDCWCKEMRIA